MITGPGRRKPSYATDRDGSRYGPYIREHATGFLNSAYELPPLCVHKSGVWQSGLINVPSHNALL